MPMGRGPYWGVVIVLVIGALVFADTQAHHEAAVNRARSGPTLNPPRVTDGSGTFIVFEGPAAGRLAADFQVNSAKKDASYWPKFETIRVNTTTACHLRDGENSVWVELEQGMDVSLLESTVANDACASFIAHGWSPT